MQILFEDNHCLAVNKPAPLLTQAPPGIPSLADMAKAYLKERCRKTGNVYLGVPHRLDRPVSGVVLFARSTKSAQRLSEQFQGRQVTKTYWGVLEGSIAPASGVWEDWLRKVADEARVETTAPGAEGARLARLTYRILGPCQGGTLVEFTPETGRMHQIRVQAATRGWPVRGDALYGARLPFGPDAQFERDRIIALHARSLTFLHPIRYEPITMTAPLPAAWRELGIESEQVQ
ncbi:MAG: RNA pseudouridine synthase [Gemmataceae bacterium]|nr:RNA pseudouridine synthase [Gemmataceae bacterium]